MGLHPKRNEKALRGFEQGGRVLWGTWDIDICILKFLLQLLCGEGAGEARGDTEVQ